MSRIWEALQKVDSGVLQDPTDTARDGDPEQWVRKPGAVPNVVQIAAHRETPLDNIIEPTDLSYSVSKQVHAERLDAVWFHTAPSSPAADRFRLLRMRLGNLSSTGKLRSVLVTSALPEDGKTTVSLNLATALADQRKRKVLLIDADLHRGSIAERLQLRPAIGLKECLQSSLNPLAAVLHVEPFGWHLLQPGILQVAQPTELLRPQDLSELLRKLSAHFDWIVLDSPPVLALTDGVALSQVVDGSLVVARAEQTPSKAVESAITLLGRKNVVGIVLNGVSTSSKSYAAYRKYHERDNSTAAATEAASG